MAKLIDNGLTRDEFLNAFYKITEHIVKVESALAKKVNDQIWREKEELQRLIKDFNKLLIEAERDSDNTFKGVRQRTNEMLNNLFVRNDVSKELKKQIKEVRDLKKDIQQKLSEIKDGYTPVKGIDYVDGLDGEPGKNAEVDEEKIIQAVLERMPQARGGGTSAIGIANAAKYFVKTEEPVGVIDGVNTNYTVSKTIFAVLSFSLNGEFIAQLPNYTISGKTVTFSTALPLAYSGKDFEIVYV